MTWWTFIYRFSWIVLAVLGIVLGASMFLPEIQKYKELQRRKLALEENIRLEEELLKHLKYKQKRLEKDPRFAERVAREELGYAKPGETVFKFVDDERDR